MAFYSYNELRSRQGLFNFILSNRGGGKTFGAKLIGIKDYLKKGQQWIYVRRYDSELDNRSQFFDDISNSEFFNDYEFKVHGYQGFIRPKEIDEATGEYIDASLNSNEWELMMYFIPLSVSLKFKSTAYPLVTKIFFDEFIIDKGSMRYLRNEVEVFLDLFETVARKRDNVDAFFLANNVSLVNPYFTYFKLYPNPRRRFSTGMDGLVQVELFTDEDFIHEKKATRFGRLIDGTVYGNYAIENQSLRDNTAFICKRPQGQGKFLGSFIVEGIEIGVWAFDELAMYYIDRKIDKDSKERYTITDSDHKPDLKQISLMKNNLMAIRLKQSQGKGLIFYNNLEIQELFKSVMKYI